MALANVARTRRIVQNFQLPKSLTVRCPFLSGSESVKSLQHALESCTARRFADKIRVPGKLPDPKPAEKPKQRKPLTSPEITLIMPDEMVTNETLEHAEKIAKRRNLKLVKILDFDTKTDRPVYKLLSSLQYFEEESKKKQQKKINNESSVKDDKLFIVSSKTAEHDLYVKINQMLKLLKKNHEVRVFISHDGNSSRTEKIAEILEDELAELATKKNSVKKSTALKLFFVPKSMQKDKSDDPDKNVKSDANKENTPKTDNEAVELKR